MHTSPKSLHSSTQPPPLPPASVYWCRLCCVYPIYTVCCTYNIYHTFPHIPALATVTSLWRIFQHLPVFPVFASSATFCAVLCTIGAHLLRCTVVCLQLVHCACIYNSCALVHCLPGAPALPAVVLVAQPGPALSCALSAHRAFSCPYNVPVTI